MTTPAQPAPPAESAAPAAAPAATAKAPGPKRSKKLVESEGIAHISATFNNVLITITDMRGNSIAWGTAVKAGF
jgi:small subunit ribosomal protein S11